MLPLHVESTLVDRAWHVHQSAGSSRSHTVLSSSSLSYDASLAHLFGEENLSERIIYLVSSRVVEVFSLEVELATIFLAHALSVVERRGSSHIVLQKVIVLFLKLRALQYGEISQFQFLYRLVEYLWDVGSAELSVEAVFVDLVCHAVYYI